MSDIQWQPIETVPTGRAILLADAIDQIVKTGIAETYDSGVVLHVAGWPTVRTNNFTHWANFPKAPPAPPLEGKGNE